MQTIIRKVNETDQIALIAFNSVAYHDAVGLRYDILRKPLGLQFTEQQLADEETNFHIGYYHYNLLIAYLMLVPEQQAKIKMKQVAVRAGNQAQGYGKKLVEAAEEFALTKGFTCMYCHARDTAVPFYEKLHYKKKGDMFLEVGIPHYEMEKQLPR